MELRFNYLWSCIPAQGIGCPPCVQKWLMSVVYGLFITFSREVSQNHELNTKPFALFPNLMRCHLAQSFFSALFWVFKLPDSTFFSKLVGTNFESSWSQSSASTALHIGNPSVTSVKRSITFSSFKKYFATLTCFFVKYTLLNVDFLLDLTLILIWLYVAISY